MPQLVARGLTINIDRPMIMAVINATPDSFSDAGKYSTVEARMERTFWTLVVNLPSLVSQRFLKTKKSSASHLSFNG
jgi:hypothetical protein